MRSFRLIMTAAYLALMPSICLSQSTGTPSSASASTCGPVTATLTGAGQSVSLSSANCLGASNYLIQVVTPNAQSALIGTLTSSDATTGGTRRFVKTGVGSLETATDTLNGQQGSLEYRTVGGGYGQTITLSAYTSGQATVTILGLYNPTTVFINGSVDTRIDVAARQGRIYTATTGIQSVAAGNYLSLQFSIPSTANYRAFITSRVLDCNVTGTTVLNYFGTSSPTVNLATTAATITNRGITGGVISSAAVTYAMATTHPDQSPSTTNPAGGFIQAGAETILGNDFMRVVSPGQTFVNWIGGTGGGLSAASSCYITYLWYEENLF